MWESPYHKFFLLTPTHDLNWFATKKLKTEFTTDNKVIYISSKLLSDLNEIGDTVHDSIVTLVEDIDSLYKYRTAASDTALISKF